MSNIIAIAGSPSRVSRSSAVLDYATAILRGWQVETQTITVRDLPLEDLVTGNPDSRALSHAKAALVEAHAVIVATPVYKAAYTGLLKLFLDVLPQNALAGKVVLPLATGGSLAHTLAISYALKPVLGALGATHILDGVYLVDGDIHLLEGQPVRLADALDTRLRTSLTELTKHISPPTRIAHLPETHTPQLALVGHARAAE